MEPEGEAGKLKAGAELHSEGETKGGERGPAAPSSFVAKE